MIDFTLPFHSICILDHTYIKNCLRIIIKGLWGQSYYGIHLIFDNLLSLLPAQQAGNHTHCIPSLPAQVIRL